MGTNKAPAPDAKAQPARKGRGCLALGVIVVVLLVLAGIAGSGSKTSSGSAPAAAPAADVPGRKVTATELWNAYEANEAAAQQMYGDQVLEVTGTVAGVDLDFANDPVVKLETPNQFMSVQADLAESAKPNAASLSKGQRIKLRCDNVSEVVGVPMLKNCSF